jgi:S1-C subfamily serine protease
VLAGFAVTGSLLLAGCSAPAVSLAIALLRITADDLHALPMGDSDQLQVGDFVIAVGNPL